MLTDLSLENFKKHRQLDVAFTDGLTLLTGPNFSGKSSILHAVLYALGGPRAVPGGKSVVTTKGEKSTTVNLGFDVNGSHYRVQRKGSSASIWKDDELQAKSASAVNGYLEELLGMDTRRFQQLRYGEQKETEALLTLGAAELHKIIQEVSQVDVVEKAIAYCSTVASETRGALSALPEGDAKLIEDEVELLNTELTEAYTLLEQLTAGIETAKEALEKANTELGHATRQNAEVRVRQSARESLEDDLRELHQRNEQIATTEVQDVEQLEAIIAQAEPQLAQAQSRKQAAEAKIVELSEWAGKVTTLELRIADTERLMRQKKDELSLMGDYAPTEPYKVMLEEATKEKAVIDAKLSELTTARNSSFCPTCKRPYEEDPDHLTAIESEISDLEKRLPEVEMQISTNRTTIEQNQLYLESRRQTEAMVDRFQYTLDAQIKDMEEAREIHSGLLREDWGARHKEAGDEVDELSSRLGAARPALKQAIQVETERAEVWRRIGEVTEALAALPDTFDYIPTGPLEAKAKVAQDSTDKARELYSNAHLNYTTEYARLSSLKERLEDTRKLEAKRESLQRRQGTATGLSKYLKSNRDRFVSDVWAGIMSYASQFASSCTGGAIEQVTRTESGSFAYVEDGEEHPIEAASGAQRSIMGLGVQLALAQMLPSALSVLLLDEPSSDMDAERSLSVASLLSAEQTQLIMVSHRELDGAVAANTIALG